MWKTKRSSAVFHKMKCAVSCARMMKHNKLKHSRRDWQHVTKETSNSQKKKLSKLLSCCFVNVFSSATLIPLSRLCTSSRRKPFSLFDFVYDIFFFLIFFLSSSNLNLTCLQCFCKIITIFHESHMSCLSSRNSFLANYKIKTLQWLLLHL